eukprot:INCI2976.1.p1 GENE.INCI2976.1~~INCI2976.1.p1  ORF type:complete len:228 (+),score=45.27 INCI2976.1:286-969(+)
MLSRKALAMGGRACLRAVSTRGAQQCAALSSSSAPMHATTILCVRRDGEVAVVGDGQVSMGSMVVKPNAVKVRRIGQDNNILTGFAGATADCFTLRERLEAKIEEYPGQLTRACVELAKNWRMDKYLRRLDAVMLVADKDVSLTVTGNGDVIEPHDGIIAIGSGGNFALAAARALIDQPNLTASEIARRSMTIAADMCVYTNHNFVEETLIIADEDEAKSGDSEAKK